MMRCPVCSGCLTENENLVADGLQKRNGASTREFAQGWMDADPDALVGVE